MTTTHTLTIEISRTDNEGGTLTKEIEVTVDVYEGTGGDDPSTSEILNCQCLNSDGRWVSVTKALEALFGLGNIQDKLEI